ncbi:MAG: UvrD-helicase domain-containing protein, partial [Nanoarchaeota archaeon]
MSQLDNISSTETISFKQTPITIEDKKIFQELDTFLSPYNDFQKKAIVSSSEKIMCIAGAGSGKTTVLTKRIEFLIRYKKIDPTKILAITFTRKARYEMYNRLSELNIQTNIETFNSFCEKILQKFQTQVYGKTVRLMDHQTKIIAFSFALQIAYVRLDEFIETYFSEQQKRSKSQEELTNILMNDCFFILDYCKSKKEDLSVFFQNIISENKKMIRLLSSVCKSLSHYIALNGFRTYNDQ